MFKVPVKGGMVLVVTDLRLSRSYMVTRAWRMTRTITCTVEGTDALMQQMTMFNHLVD